MRATHHSPNSIVRATSSIRRWPRSLVSSYFTWRMRLPRKPNASHAGVPNQRAEPPGLATKLRWGLSCSPLILPAWHSFISSGSGSTRTTALVHLVRLVLYVAATTALGLILYDRQDLVVALVAAMAVGAVARGWSVPAYLVLAAGTAYKLVPILLLPPCVLAFAAIRGRTGSSRQFTLAAMREALIAGAVLALVPVLMYFLCGGERAFVFLTFHSTRGLQVEASMAWPLFLLDSSTQLGHSFGSYTLRGELADGIARATTPLTLLVVLFAVLVSVRGFRRIRDHRELTSHFVASSLLVWLGFILCTKVGSPQYLLWLAPLAALLPFGRSARWWLVVLLASMVVTTLIYPCLYAEVKGTRIGDELIWTGPTPLGLALLAAKSILLGASFVWLAVLVWRGRWSVG